MDTTRRRLASVSSCLARMSPRSMRLASETSCWAVSSLTRPISLRYMRTGSVVGTSTLRSSSSAPRRHSSCSLWPSSSSSSSGSRDDLVDHLDALVEQSGVHVLDLLGGEVELGEDLGDVLGGDEAPTAAKLDEPVDFFEVDDPAFRRRGPGQFPPPHPLRWTASVRSGRVISMSVRGCGRPSLSHLVP